MSANRKTRLGWAEESRARAEAKRLHPDATIRQLRDLSWATVTPPPSEVRGRFGLIPPHEQVWRYESAAARELEAAGEAVREAELGVSGARRST